MNLGEEIRRIRQSKGMTQAEVAKDLFDRSYLSHIERGRVRPSLETLRHLARRLDVPFEDLLQLVHSDESLGEANERLVHGREHGDVEKVKQAWRSFKVLHCTDKMLEAVLAWNDMEGYTRDVLDALCTSIARYSEIEVSSPFYWEAMIRLGNCYFHLHQYDRAIWTYRDIISRTAPKPYLLRAWLNLGSALLGSQDYHAALEAFQKGLQMSIDASDSKAQAMCHQGLGVCYRVLGMWDEATLHWSAAKEHYKNSDSMRYFECLHNLGALAIDQGDYKEAKRLLDQSLQYFKHSNLTGHLVKVYEEYVRLHFHEGNYVEALFFADRASEIVSTDSSALAGRVFLWKVLLYHLLDRPFLARECFRAAQALIGDKVWSVFKTLSPGHEITFPKSWMDEEAAIYDAQYYESLRLLFGHTGRDFN